MAYIQPGQQPLLKPEEIAELQRLEMLDDQTAQAALAQQPVMTPAAGQIAPQPIIPPASGAPLIPIAGQPFLF